MAFNGALAGLVGITTGADAISVTGSAIIGAVAGVIVAFSVMLFNRRWTIRWERSRCIRRAGSGEPWRWAFSGSLHSCGFASWSYRSVGFSLR